MKISNNCCFEKWQINIFIFFKNNIPNNPCFAKYKNRTIYKHKLLTLFDFKNEIKRHFYFSKQESSIIFIWKNEKSVLFPFIKTWVVNHCCVDNWKKTLFFHFQTRINNNFCFFLKQIKERFWHFFHTKISYDTCLEK